MNNGAGLLSEWVNLPIHYAGSFWVSKRIILPTRMDYFLSFLESNGRRRPPTIDAIACWPVCEFVGTLFSNEEHRIHQFHYFILHLIS